MDTRMSNERTSPMNTDTVANNIDTVASNVDARVAARANTRATARNHRIVVGVIVGLVAVVAIGAVITNANRHGVVRNSANSAVPAAASPDALAPPAGQAAPADSSDVNAAPANPPPVSDNSLPPPDGSAPGAAAPAAGAAPPAANAASPSAGASRGTAYEVPAGDAAVITTANSRLEPDANTMTAFGNGRLASDSDTAVIPSAGQARASGAEAANADRQITSAVRSQIAADSTTQRSELGVTTINGIVILTGTVPAPN